jgi:hypothetical protein
VKVRSRSPERAAARPQHRATRAGTGDPPEAARDNTTWLTPQCAFVEIPRPRGLDWPRSGATRWPARSPPGRRTIRCGRGIPAFPARASTSGKLVEGRSGFEKERLSVVMTSDVAGVLRTL